MDADDSADESAEGEAEASTDNGIKVRQLARNIEAAEREQIKLKDLLNKAHAKHNLVQPVGPGPNDVRVVKPPCAV